MFKRILKLLFIFSASSYLIDRPVNRRRIIASLGGIGSSLAIPAKADEDKSGANVIVEPLTLHFYGAVTEESCFQLTYALEELNKRAKHQKVVYPQLTPTISLHIQSGGGSLMPTFYVCDTIKKIETPVDIYVDGFAASAASLMTVCGNNRYMTRNSAMLIHQLTGATSGKFNELKDEMTNLNFFMNKVKNIYLENTKLNSTILDELLASDVWLDAETCLAYGLIDKII
tara:strand:- start:2843 stop:3529 length:687 start_codon:yes stop_codon:yes gene_type:complete